ncbi:flagellar hook-basal body protein FliE [Rubripirellula amarantea]|uniref:Flagellar hook-basal body complex protein FliE n=2 Tax=Rubripirellula amarantea TaxID=2527999 RepID=A0A5C5WR19_9BACT|nr:flagellar hook-basal body protein FliE [Rubripirellula amarantea]
MSPLGDFAGKSLGAGAAKTQSTDGLGKFSELLVGEVKNVNSMQMDANGMVHSLLTGGDVNEAEVLTAVQKADLAFRMMLQVRNKLIEAYREVQQIQI